MMLFFTSDSHFFHSNILRYEPGRPWTDVVEMNEGMIRNWNSVVDPEDTVYHLGDFSLSGRSVELYSHRLNGIKKLVSGNHDMNHPYNKHQKKAEKRGEPNYWKEFYERHGWDVLPVTSTLEYGGRAFNLCHMPYDNQDPRYQQYLPKDDGNWLLCGHVHSNWRISGRMFNVGVDVNNMKPISIEQIIKEINTLEGK